MLNRSTIFAALLAAFILVPTALYGGKHELALPIAIGLIALLLLGAKNSISDNSLPWSSRFLLAFIFWIVVSAALFSTRPYASAVGLVPILGGGLIFLIIQNFRPDRKTISIFSRWLLLGAAAIILFSFYIYLSAQFPSLRMGGLFRQHNAFAGFLTALLPLAVLAANFEKKFKLLWGALAILIFTSLVLTFSRGGFIAAGLALLVFLILLRRQINWQGETLPVGKVSPWTATLAILAVSGALAYGLYAVKTANFNAVGVTGATSPYAGERPEEGETGANARFQYWRAAWRIFAEQPLAGHGLDTFGQEYRRTQTDPRFYTLDPHNLALKLLSELGLIGAILFALFLLSSLWPKLKSIWQKQTNDPAEIALTAGLIGLLLHYGVDIDLTFPAHYLLFFTLAGLAAQSETVAARDETGGANRHYAVLLTMTLILFGLVTLRYISHNYFERAKLAYLAEADGDPASFEKLLARSERYNPWNPGRALAAAEFYLDRGDLRRALELAEKARAVGPRDADTRLALGKILVAMGKNREAETEFRLAIEYMPARDLEPYTRLVNLLIETKQTEKARQVAQAGLAIFTDELFESSLWVHLDKTTVRLHQTLLKKYLDS